VGVHLVVLGLGPWPPPGPAAGMVGAATVIVAAAALCWQRTPVSPAAALGHPMPTSNQHLGQQMQHDASGAGSGGGCCWHGGNVVLPAPLAPRITTAKRFTSVKSDDGHAGTSSSKITADLLLWPLPCKLSATGSPMRLHQGFQIVWNASRGAEGAESRLLPAIGRHQRYLGGLLRGKAYTSSADSAVALKELHVQIVSATAAELPTADTDYSFSLSVAEGTAAVSAVSVFGALAGLESFVQLVERYDGGAQLKFSDIHIDDHPEYLWRGVMLDVGRRFVPIPLVQNLLSTMAAVKMSVLHLHASDDCRWAIESKLYPELTRTDATGTAPGAWTQEAVKGLVEYAADLGIRVVPEFDLPSHSRALLPLHTRRGLQFCGEPPHRNQLMPTKSNLQILKPLLEEMASLFPDKVFNIGTDETGTYADCSHNATIHFERELIKLVQDLNKTVMGWESIATAATGMRSVDDGVLVGAYIRPAAEVINLTGWRAVESSASHFYYTHPAGWDSLATRGACELGCAGPKGWVVNHVDIGKGAMCPADRALLLGGAVSMWTDDYVFPAECDAYAGRVPANGSILYARQYDNAFSHSVAGLMWPRGFVAAGSFYRFDPTLNVSSPQFVAKMDQLNDQLRTRGSWTCAPGCRCDYCSERCPGKPLRQYGNYSIQANNPGNCSRT
jgi:hexosaminidase